MKLLLLKEMRLSASALSYIFIAFSLMAFIPGYPILLAGFFICFGIFHSFQASREAGDIFYTALLPVRKSDVVRAKFTFSLFIQISALLPTLIFTFIRMNLLAHAAPYETNPMMNANIAFIGYILILYSLFNLIFIGGFFKTAYKTGIPFLKFSISGMLLIGIAETLHHFPMLSSLNSTEFNVIQLIPMTIGVVLLVALTAVSMRISERRFEKTDL